MNATMSSALNIQFLMVACMMGLILISFGAEGAPSKHPSKKGNGQHRSSDELDPASSYRLILDSEFKAPKPIRPINNDSISPWTYTFTHDENLYPSSIAEAKCSLNGCLIDDSENYLSRPIYTQIMVLRRIRGVAHNYSFRLEYKTIAVGCTCIRPYVEQV